MKALKPHKKYNQMIAEQERQAELERLEQMSPAELAAYEEEKKYRLDKLRKHAEIITAAHMACSQKPYR